MRGEQSDLASTRCIEQPHASRIGNRDSGSLGADGHLFSGIPDGALLGCGTRRNLQDRSSSDEIPDDDVVVGPHCCHPQAVLEEYGRSDKGSVSDQLL